MTDKDLLRHYERILHDIKTPISIILLSLQNLRAMPDLGHEAMAAAELCDKHAKHIAGMLADKEGRLSFAEVALWDVLDDVFAAMTPLADDKGVRLTAAGPGATIVTDRATLTRILQNLLANAIKAVKPGIGVITLNMSDDANGILIEISDNGPGFTPPQLASMFSAQDGPAGKIGGIGLHIVRDLAASLNGSVSARNGPDGAVVTLKLPKPITTDSII